MNFNLTRIDPADIYQKLQNNESNLFKVNNKDTRTMSFWCLYCYLETDFTRCSVVAIVDFEQVNAAWE